MGKYKIIILVLAADGAYTKIVNAIKDTWGQSSKDVLVLYYRGRQNSSVHLEGNDLICRQQECIANIGLKTIQALEFINSNYEFEHVVRCCAGSYIQVENLIEHLTSQPINGFCCGIDGTYNDIKYLSGSCYILSRDVVRFVLSHKGEWNHLLPDDVALGDLLSKSNFSLCTHEAKRVDLNNNGLHDFLADFKKTSILEQKTERVYEYFYDNYHFHFHNRPEYMYEIHKYFKVMKRINDNYQIHRLKKSDINEHMQTLFKYASECKSIAEFGVREGVSTWAFLLAYPKQLICVDIKGDSFYESEKCIRDILKGSDIDFRFIVGDTLQIEIPEVDLLFIDTLHIYRQLYSELKRHSNRAKKYIILHDTYTYANHDEVIYEHASSLVKSRSGINHGLKKAISDFMAEDKNWVILEEYRNNNGLTVLGRK